MLFFQAYGHPVLQWLTGFVDDLAAVWKVGQRHLPSGNLFRRAKAMVPLLVPLFVSAFRRADELAMAMEARCYHGGEGRTRLRVLRYTQSDLWALLATVGTLLATIFAGMWLK